MKVKVSILILGIILLLGQDNLCDAVPVGSAFTHQGQLKEVNIPASGTFDFEFILYDDPNAGSPLGGAQLVSGANVINGLFTTLLDFGESVFNGEARWVELAVKGFGEPNWTTLAPRQELTPAPYAIYAKKAGQVAGGIGIKGSGTPNYVPKFTDANTLTDSVIYENAGNVGIGTTSPGLAKLKISGGHLDVSSNKIVNLADPTVAQDAATKAYVDGKVGGAAVLRFVVSDENEYSTMSTSWTTVKTFTFTAPVDSVVIGVALKHQTRNTGDASGWVRIVSDAGISEKVHAYAYPTDVRANTVFHNRENGNSYVAEGGTLSVAVQMIVDWVGGTPGTVFIKNQKLIIFYVEI